MVFIKKNVCPHCGKIVDAATSVTRDDDIPISGDVTICYSCGEVGLFDEKLSVRKPTKEEYERLIKIFPMLPEMCMKVKLFNLKRDTY